MELKDIILTELRQRKTNIRFHSYAKSKQTKKHKKNKLIDTENRLVFTRGKEVKGWRGRLRGDRW